MTQYKKFIGIAAAVCAFALLAIYFSNRGCSPSAAYLCWTPAKTFAPGQAADTRADYYYLHRARDWHGFCGKECRKESECYYYCCGGDRRFDQSEAPESEGASGCSCYVADRYYFNDWPADTCRMPGNLRSLQAKAGSGDVDAQLTLGNFYENGRNDDPRPDLKEAYFWFNRAAELGSAHAQFKLGEFLETGKGVAAQCAGAIEWYEKSAARAEEEAARGVVSLMSAPARLGAIYELGSCGSLDYAKAARWYKLAEKLERTIEPLPEESAALHLGDLYMKGGYGLEKNPAEAIKWYRTVAKSPNPPRNGRAEFELAMIYAKGDVTEQDFQTACHWYAIAGRDPKYRSNNICDPIEPYLMPGELQKVIPKIGSGQTPE